MTVCSEQVVMPLEAVHVVEGQLRAAGVPSPRVDAEFLVSDVLGLARSELAGRLGWAPPISAAKALRAVVSGA